MNVSLSNSEGELEADVKEGTDSSRRRWLIATSVAGSIAGVATLVPFVDSFAPSEKARAAGAPVTEDISELRPGGVVTVAWRGLPGFLGHRTESMLPDVVTANDTVADSYTGHPVSIPHE